MGLAPSGAPIFAALLADEAVELRSDASDGFLDRRILVAPGRDDLKLVDLRSIAVGGLVPAEQAAMLATAKALMHWHARRRFCANCGALNEVAAAGWRRDCKTCNETHFPRTDPVVIMLAVDGDACLLGRQPRFPKGMYSALAGFVEPGETIEAAVRREIREEAGVACGRSAVFCIAAVALPGLVDDRLLRRSRRPRPRGRPCRIGARALVQSRGDDGADRKAAPGPPRRANADGHRASPIEAVGL